MLTLNQIIDQIKDLADNHFQIKEAGVGTIAELQAKPDRQYPLLWLSNEGGTLDNNYKIDNIRLTMFGRVITGEEGQDDDASELEVLSDMQLILLDFLNYFHQQHGQEYVTDKNNTLEHFTERTNDRTAGYSTVLELKQFYDWNRCKIPESGASIPPTVDGLTLYDFCDQSVIDRLTQVQRDCLEAELCGVCADATVENSDQSYQTTVASGATLVLPDIDFTDSHGVTTQVPSVQDIIATPCSPSVSVSVSLSDDTPKLGQVITITATATGITPTSYSFLLQQLDGSFTSVVQASNTYDWTVSKYDAFNVTVVATDGVDAGVGADEGTTTGDVDSDAFITAHDAATGGTMDATMQGYTLGFFLRLKGINTTHPENVFAEILSESGEIYPMLPDSVSGASIAGYSINAIDPSSNATMVGFVPADATVNGLTGGSGKYMTLNNAANDFDQNDVSAHAYIRTSAVAVPIGGGDGDANDNTSGVSIFAGFSSGRIIAKCNSEDFLTTASSIASNTGFISVQRDKSDRFSIAGNGDDYDVVALSSLTPSSQTIYGMAMNNNGTAARNYTGSVSCLIDAPYLNECQLKTLQEAVQWLQEQIGRNV